MFTPDPRLEAKAIHELPVDLQSRLAAVRNAIQELKAEAARWGVNREFSPDGRFLGDIGELIARLFYGVTLTVTQQKGHDAIKAEADGEAIVAQCKKVEVKLRSRSTIIDFSTTPDVVLVIYVSPITLKWGEICNGPGKKLLSHAVQQKGGKLFTDCIKLLKAQDSIGNNEKLLPCEPSRLID